MTDELPPPPTATAGDKAIGVAFAVLGEFPGGSTLVGLLQEIFGVPYARRHDAWLRKMYELLLELQASGVDVAALGDRPEFVTAVHDATRIALGEHFEQKLDMLKAVLHNAATEPSDPIADMWTLRYLRWIDELEVDHITLLRFGRDPHGCLEAAGIACPPPERVGPLHESGGVKSGTKRSVVDLAALPIASDLVDLIEEDLDRLRLGSFGALVSLDHVYDPWITDRGRRFLDWLSVV